MLHLINVNLTFCQIGLHMVHISRLHKNDLQQVNAGSVWFAEDLGLAETLRGRHIAPHEAGCGAGRHFVMLVVA